MMNFDIKKSKGRKIRPKKIVDVVLTYTGLIIISLIFLFPVLWLVLSTFNATGIFSAYGFFPQEWTLNNFRILFADSEYLMMLYNYPRWLLNTLFVSFFSMLFGTGLVILTAYTMSRFKFRSRKRMMVMTLLLGMFPSFLAMSAVFFIMAEFGLVNNLWGLILIYSAGAPLGYLVQKGFFDTIPNSIDEAARIDGATSMGVFFRIILPLSKPILVFTALTAFAWPWSDFILPQILLPDRDMWTVAVGLNSLDDTQFARFTAGSVLIAVPIITLYFILSKYLVSGLSSGATKG
ncbi:MAG: sugar ABC transporter permease [Firmicutes bacterium]|nr:sugar ABC transporter permease [Bacillota bacterium]